MESFGESFRSFVDPQVLYRFIECYNEVVSINREKFFSFLLDLTFEMPDKWTVFLPVGSVLSHFPHRSLEFLDSFRTRTGVSSVVFVWFFSRSTSLESVYPFGYFVFGQRTDCKVFESKSYNETVAESFKGQMNQKINIFSFVALPSPNTKKNHL